MLLVLAKRSEQAKSDFLNESLINNWLFGQWSIGYGSKGQLLWLPFFICEAAPILQQYLNRVSSTASVVRNAL